MTYMYTYNKEYRNILDIYTYNKEYRNILHIYTYNKEYRNILYIILITRNTGIYTVSPNKHGNSVRIFNLSTSVQLGCKINVWRGCVPASQAEVD